jgi:hypothetical protein
MPLIVEMLVQCEGGDEVQSSLSSPSRVFHTGLQRTVWSLLALPYALPPP